jgi:hypothetical protein
VVGLGRDDLVDPYIAGTRSLAQRWSDQVMSDPSPGRIGIDEGRVRAAVPETILRDLGQAGLVAGQVADEADFHGFRLLE